MEKCEQTTKHSEEEEVQSEILTYKEERIRPWESRVHAVEMAPTEFFLIEEEDGSSSSSGQKEYNFAVLIHGSLWS